MFWQTQQEIDALYEFRQSRRRIEELNADLKDFTDIFWSSNDHKTKRWARMMIKSIEHELHQISWFKPSEGFSLFLITLWRHPRDPQPCIATQSISAPIMVSTTKLVQAQTTGEHSINLGPLQSKTSCPIIGSALTDARTLSLVCFSSIQIMTLWKI